MVSYLDDIQRGPGTTRYSHSNDNGRLHSLEQFTEP